MKNFKLPLIILILLFNVLSISVFSQGNTCATAHSLGTLPTPAGCPSGAGATVTHNGTTAGATAANPYTYIPDCGSGTTDMTVGALDVWYTFVASGNSLLLDITAGTIGANPNVGLYTGTCSNLSGIGCSIGNQTDLVFEPLTPGQRYYIQVSGNTTTAAGTFTLTINNNNDCNDCLRSSNLTVTPQPINGTYGANTTVNFCYQVTDYQMVSSNWLHGIQLTFGSGWDPATITTTPPSSCSGDGSWKYYATGIGTVNGTNWGPGFYFDYTPLNNDPTDNYGDYNVGSTGPCDLRFCWSIKTDVACTQGAPLSILVQTSGDGESGSWTSVACQDDPATTFEATSTCCLPPTVVSTPVTCFGGSNGTATGTVQGTISPWDYAWINSSGATISSVNNSTATTYSVGGLAVGTYTLQVTDNNGCTSATTVAVTQGAVSTVTVPANVTQCANTTVAAGTITPNPITATVNWTNSNTAIGLAASGSGTGVTTIPSFTATNSTTSPITATITATPTSGGCAGTPSTYTITVNPLPTVTIPTVAAICGGSTTLNATYSPVPAASSQVFQNTTATGDIASTGTTSGVTVSGINPTSLTAGQINSVCFTIRHRDYTELSNLTFTIGGTTYSSATTPALATLLADIQDTPPNTGGGNPPPVTASFCLPTSFLNTVTGINPNAAWSVGISDIVSGGDKGVIVSSTFDVDNVPASTFSWANTATLSGTTSGTNATGSLSVTASPTVTTTYTLSVTNQNGCVGTNTVTVNVGSLSTVAVPASFSVCPGNVVPITTFTPTPGTASLNWSSSNTAIGLASASGTGNLPSFTATNAGTTPITSVITVTPTVSGCAGTPSSFTITVNPRPTVTVPANSSVCPLTAVATTTLTSTPAGATYAWANNNTATGLGASGTGNVPAFTTANASTSSISSVITVTPTLNSCAGPPSSYTITVYPTPTVTVPANFSVCNAATVAASNFTSTPVGGTFAWSNSNTAIGLGASGTGNTPSFTATNTTTAPITGVITVTPTVNGCPGTPSSYTITVNPTPTVTVPANLTPCAGQTVAASSFTSIPAGGTFAWVNNNTATGLGASGTGNTPSFTATNATSAAITSVVTVTPTVNTCPGTPSSYTITVNPLPTVTVPTNTTVCAGTSIPATTLTSTPAGASYTWVNSNTATGLAANGTGNVPLFVATNTTTAAITSTITVTPTLGTCVGTGTPYTVTVNPLPVATFTNSPNQCLNTNTFNFTNTGTVAATHSWTFPSGTPATSGSVSPTGVTWATVGTFTVTHLVTVGTCTASTTGQITIFPRPTPPGLVGTNPTCGNNNGQITVTAATGGTGALSYNLNGGANTALTNYTGLAGAPTTYTVNVTDINACTNNATVTLTAVPFVTSVNLTSSTAHCSQADGSVDIGTAVGGVGPYTYSYNVAAGPFTALTPTVTVGSQAPNTYTVYVKDGNNCSAQNTVTVANAAGPTGPNASSVNSTCTAGTNGSVTLAPPTTGTGPFTYAFNNAGASFSTTTLYSNLTAGTYTYVVKDAFGCPLNGSVDVSNTPGPTGLVLTPTTEACDQADGTIIIGAVTGGTSGYTYSTSGVGGPFTATSPVTGLAAGTYSVTVRDANGCLFTNSAVVTELAPPSDLALTTVPASCGVGAADGEINIGAVTGGTAGYTYSVNSGAFGAATNYPGLTATTHTVIVKDSRNCTYQELITIGTNSGPTAMVVTSTASACNVNDGTVSIGAVTGGTGPFNYSFNSSAYSTTVNYSNIGPGTYPVSVQDDNSCIYATTIVVDPSQLPTAQIVTPTNSTCGNANGTVVFGATTGGTPGYTYSFNNSAYSPTATYTTAAGTYNVGVTDSKGCTYTTTVVVANTPGPTDLVLTPTSSTCGNNNGEVDVTTTTGGTSNYTYTIDAGASQASTNFSGLSATTHTVEVTDANNCTYSETVSISNIIGPTAQDVTPTNSTCSLPNGTIVIGATTDGTSPYTWQVDGVGGFTTTTNYSGLAAGTHTVEVLDANLCPLTVTVTVDNTAGPTALTLAPTPANCGNNNGTVSAISVTGGTTNYTYSIDGTNFQAGITFSNLAPGPYTVTVKDANNCVLTNTTTVTDLGTPAVAIAGQTNIDCNGNTNGSVTVSGSGGQSPYVFTLNTGETNGSGVFNNLAAGTYTVTIEDDLSCTATNTFVITEPDVLTASIQAQTNVSCFNGSNGSVTVTQLGGTTPYTYSINGGAFGVSATFGTLTATDYSVTVQDDNGCSVVVPVTITEPTEIILSMSSTNANCTDDNGTASVSALGGTGAYTYSWTGGGGSSATTVPVIGGDYTVTVTDANLCVATGTVTIDVTTGGTATIASTTNVTCNGANNGSINVSMGGNAVAPFTYAWTPNVGTTATVTNLGPGAYSVVVTDVHGCIANANTTITEPAALTVNFTSTNVSCNGGNDGTVSATVAGGTMNYSYLWSPGAYNTPIISGLSATVYSVTVTDVNGCTVSGTRSVVEPTPLAITPTITHPHCQQPDGSATVAGSGGAGGYTFAIDGGAFGAGSFTGLLAGTYTITIQDANQCTNDLPISLVDQNGPTASITASSNVSCNGGSNGSATVTAVGGTTPYTYLWTPSAQTTQTANNLSQGVYGVTVTDDEGCTASASVVITEPDLLTVNATGIDPTCNSIADGTVNASALGGTTPYSFQWATLPVQTTSSITNVLAGDYQVTVTDANMCTATTSVTLVDPPLFTVSVTNTPLSCFGVPNGTATASNNNGTAPFIYTWTDPNAQSTQTATGLAAGTFTVNVVDFKGCIASAVTTVTQPASPLTTAIANIVDVTCAGLCNGSGEVNPSGGTAPYSYSWSNSVSSQTNIGLCAGSYTATVTDNNGCTSESVLTITEPDPLVVNATHIADASCFGVCDGQASATFSGGTAPYTFMWSPSLASGFSQNALCAGTHVVTITDANNCTEQSSVVINEPAQLTASTVVIGNNFCQQNNGSAQVQVSGGTAPFDYLWNNGATTALITSLTDGVYVIAVTDANNCVANSTATINAVAGPTITSSNIVDISCFGLNDGSADVVVAGGTTPYNSQTWLLPVNLIPNPNQTGDGLWPGDNVYQVVDAAGCITSLVVPINEPTQLVSATNSVVDVTCNGMNNGSANVLVNGGTPNYTYQWTDASAQTNANAFNLVAGTYTCNITDANGCLTSQVITITEPMPLVITTASISQITCNGANDGAISVSTNGGTPFYSFAWTPSVGTGANITNLIPGTYSLTLTDVNGCDEFYTNIITEPMPYVVSAVIEESRCSNPDASIALTVSGSTAPYTYQWNDPSVQTTATASGLIAPATYMCVITDLNGCTTTYTASTTDLPAPEVTAIDVVNVSCNGGDDGTLTATIQVGGGTNLTYAWYNNAGGLMGNGSFQGSLPIGTYQIVVTDENGCVDNANATITEPLPLYVTASADAIVCNGQTLGISAAAGNGTAPYTYSWSDDGVGLVGGGNHNILFTNTNATSDFQLFSVSVTDANNCPAVTEAINITVLPKITITANDLAGCVGSIVNLSASATGGDGAPYNFTWGLTPSITQTGTVSSVSVTVTSNPVATYSLIVDDGCSSPETITINVSSNPKPDASIVGVNTQGCEDLNVSFTGNAGAGFTGSTFDWSFGDNTSGTGQDVTHVYTAGTLSAQYYNVQLIVTSSLGCKDTMLINNYITVYPTPVAEFTFDPLNPTEFDSEINFFNQSLIASTYNWNFGDLTSLGDTSSLEHPKHTYFVPGLYDVTLAVASDRGCVDTIVHPIYIEPEFAIYVPNAFSPNDDADNEIFSPQGIGIDEKRYNLYIYNRWGELIFESNNFSIGWDGRANGGKEIAQEDVYIWKISAFDIKNNRHSLVGHVTLVR